MTSEKRSPTYVVYHFDTQRLSPTRVCKKSLMVDPSPISHSSQCSTTGVTKAVLSNYPLCEMMHIKDSLPLLGKNSSCSGGSGFSLSLSK